MDMGVIVLLLGRIGEFSGVGKIGDEEYATRKKGKGATGQGIKDFCAIV
jgi:hypothetical protein